MIVSPHFCQFYKLLAQVPGSGKLWVDKFHKVFTASFSQKTCTIFSEKCQKSIDHNVWHFSNTFYVNCTLSKISLGIYWVLKVEHQINRYIRKDNLRLDPIGNYLNDLTVHGGTKWAYRQSPVQVHRHIFSTWGAINHVSWNFFLSQEKIFHLRESWLIVFLIDIDVSCTSWIHFPFRRSCKIFTDVYRNKWLVTYFQLEKFR